MTNLEETARLIRNQSAKEWRAKNKEKVAEINKRYWLKRAQKFIEEKEEK